MKKVIMKRKIAFVIILVICMQLLATTSFAADTQNNTLLTASSEIQNELAFAEELLGGDCKLELVEKEIVGDYIVENRLYVLDDDNMGARASSGERGGISAQTWTPLFSNEYAFKVLLAGFFYYNGTVAITIPEKTDCWIVNNYHEEVDGLEAHYSYKNGTSLSPSAKVSCSYLFFDGGHQPYLSGDMAVTCSKTGEVGITSEDKTMLV